MNIPISQKKIKPYWTHEDKMRLIELAQERPVLWNTYYPYYRELNQRKSALEEIKEALGDKFCVDEVNSQWRNLKDVFYKKKSQHDQKLSIEENVEEPSWKYWRPLSFLSTCADERTRIMRRKFRTMVHVPGGSINLNQGQNSDKSYPELILLDQEVDESEKSDFGLSMQSRELKTEDVSEFTGSDSIHSPNVSSPPDEAHPYHALLNQPLISILPVRRQKRPYPSPSGTLRAQSSTIAVTTAAFPLSTSQNTHPPVSAIAEVSPNPDLRSIAMVLDSLRSNQTRVEPKIQEKDELEPKRRPEVDEKPEKGSDRFKYFGIYVESALKDIYQQSPTQALSLQQSIYALISQNQLELMNRNL